MKDQVKVRMFSVITILIILFAALGLPASVARAAGTIYYVDNTVACDDYALGSGSMALPFCHIQRGADVALTPGDTVYVLHGTYAETVIPAASGTVGNPITFKADPGVTVNGQPGTPTLAYSGFAVSTKSYIVIDGFNIDNTSLKGIYVDSSSYITISRNHVTRAGASSQFHPYEQGIYVKNTSYSQITENTTDHNTCIGIRVVGGGHNEVSKNLSFSNYSVIETDAAGIELTGSSYNTVINNITYSNEDSGINIYIWDTATPVQSTYNLIIGNLSYENGDHGIDHNNSPYNTVIGNTVQGNGTVGINFEGETTTGSHHATVANNISVGNGFTPPTGSFGGNLRVDSASIAGTTIDYDLFNRESASVQIIWNNNNYVSLAAFKAAVPTQEVHGLEGNPLFVDPVVPALRQTGVPYVGAGAIGDYHLTLGSPAIDSANSNASNEPLYDIEGTARVDDPETVNTGAGTRSYDDRGAYEYQPRKTSTTVVNCGTGTPVVTYGSTISCVATVTASSGTVSPTGHVTWTTGGSGTFTGNPCTLSGSGGTATCSVTYQPSAVGTGSHLITAAYAGDGGFISSSSNQTVTVNRKAASVTPNTASKVYGSTDPALTGVLTGFVAADNVTATYTRVAGETVASSPYTISATLSPAGALVNYNVTYNTANFSVTPKPLTITSVVANGKVYDRTATATLNLGAATLVGVIAPDVVTINSSSATATFASTNAGTWAVTASGFSLSGAGVGNYTLAAQPTVPNATITPKSVSLTGVLANNKTYDGTTAATFNLSGASLTGVIAPDVVTINSSSATGTFASANAGTWAVTASGFSLSGAAGANYTLVTQPTVPNATISPKAASVTPSTASKVYGSTDPALTGVLTGFVAADNVTATYSRTAGETVAGSPYTISATLSPAGVLGNYTITYNTASFTITKRPITVTADAKSKVYGSIDPALTYHITSGSLFGTDTFSGALGRVAGENIGTYAITQGSLVLNANYNLTFVGANLTITKVPLTVKADDKAISYGDPDPIFTITYSGFLTGETAAVLDTQPTCDVADPHTDMGMYPIVCSGGADTIYSFVYVNGVLTVGTVTTPPPAATLINPTAGISTIKPTYSWNEVLASSWYRLFVNTPSGTIIDQWYEATVCNSGVCSVTPDITLTNGTSYNWWIQTWNSYGAGPWSTAKSFNVAIALPGKATLTSPNGAISTNKPTYTWTPVTGASWYYLWVSGPSGPVIKTWYDASVCTTSCSVTPDITLTNGTSYNWWIQTWNPGGTGPWSDAMSFNVAIPLPGKATLTSPNGTISTTKPTYTWTPVTGSTWYYLSVKGPSGPVIQTWYDASVCTTSCSVTPTTALANGTNYTWWVQTWNPGGTGPWSDAMSFNVAIPLPGKATLTSPNGAISTVQPTYSWTLVTGSTWYYLSVKAPSGPVIQTWYKASDVCISGTCSVTPTTTLTNGGSYTWWVQTWNEAGTGPWSDPANFNVATP